MRVPHSEAAGPPIINSRARLVTVKTPRTARPRRRRADGLDGANDEPPMAIVGGPPEEWRRRECEIAPRNAASISASSAPAILVTIGQQTRIFHAFVTSAPPVLDAPATVTLCAFVDVAAHDDQRGNTAELLENQRAAGISGVDDQTASCHRGQGLGAHQAVRVGDQPHDRGIAHWHSAYQPPPQPATLLS